MKYLSGRVSATAEDFSYAMWPNSPSWKASIRAGVGVCFSGRALLNRMIDEGWVSSYKGLYSATLRGKRELKNVVTRRAKDGAKRVHQNKRYCGSKIGRAVRQWKDVTCPGCLRKKPSSRSPSRKRRALGRRSRT